MLLSCNDNGEDAKAAYIRGVNRGAKNAVMRLEQEGKAMRLKMRNRLARQLLPLSVFLVVVTLFGAKAADYARGKLCAVFRVSLAMQLILAKAAYAAIMPGTLAASFYFCGIRMTLPVLVLLAGSIIPFMQYLDALKNNDRDARRLSLTKIKTLFFYSLTIMLLSQILSDTGFMAIKLGR
jgi:hypothetical protein